MAKHCDVCNQDYADDLAACPHCAAAKKTQLASSHPEDRRTQLANTYPSEPGSHPFSDSAVDLGQSPTSKPATGDAAGVPPASMSGVSSGEWSALAEQPPSDRLKIDSPSDADLLRHGAAESVEATPSHTHEEIIGDLFASEPPAPASDVPDSQAEVMDLTGSPPELASSVSDSSVDLGASPVFPIEEDAGAVMAEAAPSDSQVFMAELASDASKVDLVSDSGINLGEEEIVELEAASASGRDLIAEAVEAGIDPNTPEAERTEEVAFDKPRRDEFSSTVDLGAPLPSSIEPVSAASAEEVFEVPDGSGIDLDGLTVPSGAGSSSGVRPSSESSVDLGSEPDFAAPSPSGDEVVEAAEVVEDSGVDLGGVHELTPAASNDSNLVLESLLADSSSGKSPIEEEAALVEDEAVGSEVTDEAAALAAVEEPVVSEAEVDELLAGLEETPTSVQDLAVKAEKEAAATDVAEGEEAIAAAEAEVAAEEAEAEAEEEVAAEEGAEAEAQEEEIEEEPAKPVKQRSRIPALVGGTFLGLLLGTGGLIGGSFGGIDVPALIGAGEQKKTAPAAVVPQAKVPTFKDRAAFVNNGDWDEAAKAGIDQVQDTPEELAVRGSYRLGAYLKMAGSKINPQDPALQLAINDLKKAAEAPQPNADAIYDLGLINELANKPNEAHAEYTKGLQASQNDAFQKRRFQSALDRLDLRTSAKAPGAALVPLPERSADRAALLALLLIGLQQAPQPAGQPPAPPAGQPAQANSDEAGFDFWEAAKMARQGDFSKAIAALDKARATHDQRRFTRLRKAQNPFSDPTEDIFLRCCDELKQYWLLESQLREQKYLTEKNTPQEALQSLLKQTDASAKIVASVTEPLIKEKVIASPDEAAKGVADLIAAKKDAETKLDDLKTQLEKSTKETTDLAGKLKTAQDTIKDRDTKLKAAAEQELKLKAANDDLGTNLKKIADELVSAKFLDPTGKPDVGEAVRKAVDLAKIKDPQGLIRTQRNELAQMSASLKQRWHPEEMMPMWLTILEQNRTRTEWATKAALDADRVKADPTATPAQNGQAQIVLGLALRNTEKFGEAKTVLQSARNSVDKTEWLIVADAALREVSNPAAYYADQAQRLYDRGQMNAALAALDRAMPVLPVRTAPGCSPSAV